MDDLAHHTLIAVVLGEHPVSLLAFEFLYVEIAVLIFEVSHAVNLAAEQRLVALCGLLVVLMKLLLAFVDLIAQASAEFLFQQLV